MSVDKFIRQASQELGLPYDVCHRAYMAAWKFIYAKVQEHDLSIDTPMEDFLKYRTNINIKGIGKLFITPKDFELKNKKFLAILKYKKEKDDKNNKDD